MQRRPPRQSPQSGPNPQQGRQPNMQRGPQFPPPTPRQQNMPFRVHQ